MTQITVRSSCDVQVLDVTHAVCRAIQEATADGWVVLNIRHTTAALVLTEYDPELLDDLEKVARGLLTPFEPFTHHTNDNPNAQAHLLSVLLGTQVLVRARRGRVQLGAYQHIVLIDLDGPRERTIDVSAVRDLSTGGTDLLR